MNLCSFGHEEVCYECGRCPVCQKMAEYEETLQEKNNMLEGLQAKVEALEERCQT